MFTVDGTTPVSPKEVINITTSPMSKELSKAHGIQTFSTKTLESIDQGLRELKNKALKLKEVSYRSAEGFAAGEIKHGPISIIDKGTPVIVLMPHDALFEKMLSACQECRARGAFVVAVTTKAGAKMAADVADQVFIVPQTNELLQPVLDVVPLQFLAYWIAKRLGCDIDQPRNLAKSVTVE